MNQNLTQHALHYNYIFNAHKEDNIHKEETTQEDQTAQTMSTRVGAVTEKSDSDQH